jgi:mannose-6-phosphate isomerase-like protein (cupin superfamily)
MLRPLVLVQKLQAGSFLGPNLSEQWPFPSAYDSVFAAPNNYRLLYEDGHIRLLEVTVRPGETTPMHGHPYASVLAFNAVTADANKIVDAKLVPDSPFNGQGAGYGPPPRVFNMKVPTCMTVAPQAPHAITNNDIVPLHYYRIEFKRVDGDAFQSHWRDWYPWMKYMH